MKKVTNIYYEVKTPDNVCYMMGFYKSVGEALDAINDSYEWTRGRGLGNPHNAWIIVRVKHERTCDDKGNWLKDKEESTLVNHVEYSEEKDKFVLAR